MADLRVLFALPGFHRVQRGAEITLEEVARGLARTPGFDVTLIGSGRPREGEPYRFRHAGCVPRERFERWPKLPLLRDEYAWEELTFLPGLLRQYDPSAFDVTVGCSFPFTHWALRRGRRTPPHVYVTQNGDWPAQCDRREYRYFDCDGLVCTNPEYFDRNRERYRCTLIPNGVDPGAFTPDPLPHATLGFRDDRPLALIVSALIPSKRVIEGVEAVAQVDGLQLLVAGDGPLRDQVTAAGERRMGDRFARRAVPRERMPAVYRAADVLLHMSVDEPFGNVYLEALATGLPVVAHDWSVTRWMLEDQAVLVDTHDTQAVIGGLHEALTRRAPDHVAGRRELIARRYAWPIVVKQYAEFIEQVAHARD